MSYEHDSLWLSQNWFLSTMTIVTCAAFFLRWFFVSHVDSLVFVRHIDNFSFVNGVTISPLSTILTSSLLSTVSTVLTISLLSTVLTIDLLSTVLTISTLSTILTISPLSTMLTIFPLSTLLAISLLSVLWTASFSAVRTVPFMSFEFLSAVWTVSLCQLCGKLAFVSCVDNSAFVSCVDNSLCLVSLWSVALGQFVVDCCYAQSSCTLFAAAWKRSFLLTFLLHLMTDKQLHWLQKRW